MIVRTTALSLRLLRLGGRRAVTSAALVGVGMARSARAPAALLAGRRLLDDPRGAFRPLAGVTMAVFVAGFLAPLTAAVPAAALGDDTALRIAAPSGAVAEL